MSNSDAKIIRFLSKSGNAMDDAIEWQSYLYSGKDTEEGRAAFHQWLVAATENSEAFHKVEQWWQDADYAIVSDPEMDAQTVGFAEVPPKKTHFLMHKIWIAGASIAASLLIAFLGWQAVFYNSVTEQNYATLVGEIRTVSLADGSEITLGGASALITRFSEKERNVELLEGQAYFDVSRDENRWFKVRAGTTEIQVLGTEFDVQKGRTDVRVAVTKGLVEVKTISDEQANTASREIRQLKKGDMIYSSDNGILGEKVVFDVASVAAWRKGRLEYNKTPLSRVIEEVNRYRNQKIVLADDALGDIPISIVLPIGETDELLSGLEFINKLEVSRSLTMVTIRTKNK